MPEAKPEPQQNKDIPSGETRFGARKAVIPPTPEQMAALRKQKTSDPEMAFDHKLGSQPKK